MAFLTEMAGQNGHEVGIALRGEHRERVPERPDHQPGDPLLQPQTKRGGDRPVDDRDCTRGAPEQNRLGKRPVQRSLEPLDMGACPDHEISAPPPKLKKLRKKEEAAKAIDSPQMTWMRRRKNGRASCRETVCQYV